MGEKDSLKARDQVMRIRAILLNPFSSYPGITERERSILTLASKGKTSREIAEEMNLSEKAVGTILYRLKPRIRKTKAEMVQHLISQIEKVVGE